MSTNEAVLKQALVKEMRQQMKGAVIFRHEDRHIFGVPDISCTWGGITSWWEVKFANPSLKITNIQVLTCKKLSREGSVCGVIIYQVYRRAETTSSRVINPLNLKSTSPAHSPNPWNVLGVEIMYPGFDHFRLARYIKGEHQNAVDG